MNPIISVLSAKGGVGNSTFCLQLGKSLVEKQKKILVVELDPQGRSLDLLAGCHETAVFHLSDVLEGRCKPVDAIQSAEGYEFLHILPCGIGELEEIGYGKLRDFCQGIAEFYNYVILDISPSIHKRWKQLIQEISHTIIFVSTTEVASVRSNAALARELGWNQEMNSYFVLNLFDVEQFQQGSYPTIDHIMDEMRVQLLGIVPFDRKYLIRKNKLEKEKNTVLSTVYDDIGSRILGKYKPLHIK